LIDQAGLKGTRWGGVGVSPVHANFLVNHGEGRAADVFSLAREVRQRVTDGFGVTLEPEPLLVGRTWAEIWQDG
ncbi:MAG: UDP-N-acetylenolpyruvoylglucosamine reductase, partial [Opitutales bacterium]